MKTLTSISSPLRIDALQVAENQGWLGMTICPGKVQPNSISGHWQRDLGIDVQAIQAWGASTVLTLLEDFEFVAVEVTQLGEQVQKSGMEWIHIPIKDRHAPSAEFEQLWPSIGPRLHAKLDLGEKILVHCMGGIGRTGTVVAQLLMERGWNCDHAITEIRRVRQGAIETRPQEDYLQNLAKQLQGNTV